MSALVSRVVVAAAGIPAVLGLLYLGGWWLFVLAAAAGLVALHELYGITRPLRPVVLAGYVGALAALLGAQLGGSEWALGGFLVTFALGLVFKGLGGTKQSTTVSVAVTVLGAGWIGLGLAHMLLVRAVPEHGLDAALAVLLAVWGADTAAYVVGRVVGRHKLAPTISPGKTWEGFVAGAIAAVVIPWVWLYETGFLQGWRSLALGGAIAIAGPLGDLFESAVKRDVGVKDSGRLLGAHGGMLDRLDALLFSAVAAYYVIAAVGGA